MVHLSGLPIETHPWMAGGKVAAFMGDKVLVSGELLDLLRRSDDPARVFRDVSVLNVAAMGLEALGYSRPAK
jgi:hypothetical protein